MSASSSEWVIDVGEADFETAVLERSRELPVVVDFWAPWCGPCLALGPVLERLVEERAGQVLLARVNVDDAQRLAIQYGVQGIPAVKAFRDGRVVLEFVGALPESQLRAFLERVCPSEADRLAQQAAALEASDPVRAESLYRQALGQDRNQDLAAVGLARLLMARGEEGEAADLLGRVAGGAHGAEAEQLQAILALRQQGRPLGDEAAARQRVTAEPDHPRRRYELGCVLAAAGKYREALDELLTAGERDLALARGEVRETMVRIFHAVGVRSPLADEYRDKLTRLLY